MIYGFLIASVVLLGPPLQLGLLISSAVFLLLLMTFAFLFASVMLLVPRMHTQFSRRLGGAFGAVGEPLLPHRFG